MTCSSCGGSLAVSDAFCPRCGQLPPTQEAKKAPVVAKPEYHKRTPRGVVQALQRDTPLMWGIILTTAFFICPVVLYRMHLPLGDNYGLVRVVVYAAVTGLVTRRWVGAGVTFGLAWLTPLLIFNSTWRFNFFQDLYLDYAEFAYWGLTGVGAVLIVIGLVRRKQYGL